MDVTRRDLLKGAAAVGIGGALAQARPVSAQTTQKKELVTAQSGDISKFDPHYSTSSNDIRVSFNLFDNLVSRHPDGKLAPSLATEWKLEAQTVWRFKLRQGVKFHNGDPLTSADVKYSIERTYDPAAKTMVATVLGTIEKVDAPDASISSRSRTSIVGTSIAWVARSWAARTSQSAASKCGTITSRRPR